MNDQVRWKDMTHEQRQEYAAVKNREYRQRLKEMYGTTRPKRGQQPLLRKPTIDPKQLKMPRISQFTFRARCATSKNNYQKIRILARCAIGSRRYPSSSDHPTMYIYGNSSTTNHHDEETETM